MAFRIAYLALARALSQLALLPRFNMTKEVEILVLRHEVACFDATARTRS